MLIEHHLKVGKGPFSMIADNHASWEMAYSAAGSGKMIIDHTDEFRRSQWPGCGLNRHCQRTHPCLKALPLYSFAHKTKACD